MSQKNPVVKTSLFSMSMKSKAPSVFPTSHLLRPVTYIKEQNASIISEVSPTSSTFQFCSINFVAFETHNSHIILYLIVANKLYPPAVFKKHISAKLLFLNGNKLMIAWILWNTLTAAEGPPMVAT